MRRRDALLRQIEDFLLDMREREPAPRFPSPPKPVRTEDSAAPAFGMDWDFSGIDGEDAAEPMPDVEVQPSKREVIRKMSREIRQRLVVARGVRLGAIRQSVELKMGWDLEESE